MSRQSKIEVKKVTEDCTCGYKKTTLIKDDLFITRAEKSDAAEILKLQYAAYRSEAELYNDYMIQPLTQTLAQSEAEFKNCIVLKAVINNKIVGSVRAYEKNDSVFIGKLMVLPSFQNKGIGRQLLQAIEQEFPYKRYELFTGSKSLRNIAVYERCGYKVFRTESAAPELTFVYMEKKPVVIREISTSDYLL